VVKLRAAGQDVELVQQAHQRIDRAGGQPNAEPVRNPERSAIETAPVWFTAYPASMITKPSEFFLATLSADALWAAFETLGIATLHRSGETRGWDLGMGCHVER
jgi:hypothetical protein